MASIRKMGSTASILQALTLVTVWLTFLVLEPMAGLKMEDWYDMNASYNFVNAHSALCQFGNMLPIFFGITMLPSALAVFQRFRSASPARAILFRGFSFISAACWILSGTVGVAALQMVQSAAAHGHPDPNAAGTMFTAGSVSWGLQNAAITCWGIYLYLAGRSALQSGKLAKWAAYLAVGGGAIAVLNVPLSFLGDTVGMVGFFLTPLCGILFNIAFALNLRNAPENELEAAMG